MNLLIPLGLQIVCVKLNGRVRKSMVVAVSSIVLRIWQNIVEENKYDNMEGKMGEEGKEFFNSK